MILIEFEIKLSVSNSFINLFKNIKDLLNFLKHNHLANYCILSDYDDYTVVPV